MTLAAVANPDELELPWPKPALRLLPSATREAAPYDAELDDVSLASIRAAAWPAAPYEPAERDNDEEGVFPVEVTDLLVPVHVGHLADRQARRSAVVARRRRVALVALVAGLLVALVLPIQALAGRTTATGVSPLSGQAGHVYVVQPGDTLWTIANRLTPNGDPRPVVDRLAAQIGSDTVVPGEHLTLP